jgi:hypothetical protein
VNAYLKSSSVQPSRSSPDLNESQFFVLIIGTRVYATLPLEALSGRPARVTLRYVMFTLAYMPAIVAASSPKPLRIVGERQDVRRELRTTSDRPGSVGGG